MRRLPSIKTLSRVFGDPKRARAILEMTRAQLIEQCPAAAERNRASYHPHKTYVLRLDALNAIDAGLHGVESVRLRNGQWLEYLNTGEMYAETMIYMGGRYRVACLGDLLERMS